MFKEYYQYHYDHLNNDNERKLYTTMFNAIKHREKYITFDYHDVDTTTARDILEKIYEDHPSFFYIKSHPENLKVTSKVTKFYFNYIYDKQTSDRYEEKIKHLIEYVFKEYRVMNMSLYHRIIFIHDMIASICKYDPVVSQEKKTGADEDYNIIGVFSGKLAVCYGFSLVFKLLCDYADIPCLIEKGDIKSSGVLHAWNIVKYEGQFYSIDVTWDLMEGEFKKYKYFMVNDEWMKKSRDFYRFTYPACHDLSYTYYEYNHYSINDLRELPDYLYNRLLVFPKTIDVYIRNKVLFEDQTVYISFNQAITRIKESYPQVHVSPIYYIDHEYQLIKIVLNYD